MHWNLIHKYLTGQCTEAEQEHVEQWLQESPEHREFMQSARKIWEVPSRSQGSVDVKAAWNRFRSGGSMTEGDGSAPIHTMDKRLAAFKDYRRKTNRSWYQKAPTYAAAAAIVLLATVLYIVQNRPMEPVEAAYQEITTARGEKTSMKLSDGTRVMLNVQSTLRIPSNYGENNRTLYLEGEAFFEVEHDEKKPFLVYSGDVYTEDLGTKFNIRAFPEDPSVEVTVTEGEVELGSTRSVEESPVHLTPNERAVVSAAGQTAVQKVDDLSFYIGWTQGKLVFKDTPLKDVMRDLERWFAIECSVTDSSLLDRPLTATFDNESLSNVLGMMEVSMDLKVDKEKKTVMFGRK